MGSVIEFNRKRVFSVSEAKSILPLVYKITEAASREVANLIEKLESARSTSDQLLADGLDQEINRAIDRWQSKVEKLGATPKGMWIADFDSGDGYFCWKFPEREIRFWHGYQDGYLGRVLIEKLNGTV